MLVVAEASKKTASGATPEVRAGTRDRTIPPVAGVVVVGVVLVEVEPPPPLPHEARPKTANSAAKKTPERTFEPTVVLFNISI